jgi:hypothetical protein
LEERICTITSGVCLAICRVWMRFCKVLTLGITKGFFNDRVRVVLHRVVPLGVLRSADVLRKNSRSQHSDYWNLNPSSIKAPKSKWRTRVVLGRKRMSSSHAYVVVHNLLLNE